MTAQDLMRLGFARYMVKLGKYTDECVLTEHEAAWEPPPKRHEVWTAQGLVMMEDAMPNPITRLYDPRDGRPA